MTTNKKSQSPNLPVLTTVGEHTFVPHAFDLKCHETHKGFMKPDQVYGYLQLLFPMLGKWEAVTGKPNFSR